jgi:mRNA interferase RelE/StbE
VNRQVIWLEPASADLAAIARQDRRTAERIVDAVNRLAEHNVGDVRKLAGGIGEYRLRVGDWRVIFTFEDSGRALVVGRVLRRNEGTYRA